MTASVFAFPEIISLSHRCASLSFLFPSLLFFVVQAMVSNVHYLVPLVQEVARRKVFEYRHMLRFFSDVTTTLPKKKKKNRNNKNLIIRKKTYVYIFNSDPLALIVSYNSSSVIILSHMGSKIDLIKVSSHNTEYLFSFFRFSFARIWLFIQGQL